MSELLTLLLLYKFCWASLVAQMVESACNAGDLGLIPGLGRFSGGGHGNPLQFSCLENLRGQRGLVGYSPWSHKELDTTWATKHYLKGKCWYSLVCLNTCKHTSGYNEDVEFSVMLLPGRFFPSHVITVDFLPHTSSFLSQFSSQFPFSFSLTFTFYLLEPQNMYLRDTRGDSVLFQFQKFRVN